MLQPITPPPIMTTSADVGNPSPVTSPVLTVVYFLNKQYMPTCCVVDVFIIVVAVVVVVFVAVGRSLSVVVVVVMVVVWIGLFVYLSCAWNP